MGNAIYVPGRTRTIALTGDFTIPCKYQVIGCGYRYTSSVSGGTVIYTFTPHIGHVMHNVNLMPLVGSMRARLGFWASDAVGTGAEQKRAGYTIQASIAMTARAVETRWGTPVGNVVGTIDIYARPVATIRFADNYQTTVDVGDEVKVGTMPLDTYALDTTAGVRWYTVGSTYAQDDPSEDHSLTFDVSGSIDIHYEMRETWKRRTQSIANGDGGLETVRPFDYAEEMDPEGNSYWEITIAGQTIRRNIAARSTNFLNAFSPDFYTARVFGALTSSSGISDYGTTTGAGGTLTINAEMTAGGWDSVPPAWTASSAIGNVTEKSATILPAPVVDRRTSTPSGTAVKDTGEIYVLQFMTDWRRSDPRTLEVHIPALLDATPLDGPVDVVVQQFNSTTTPASTLATLSCPGVATLDLTVAACRFHSLVGAHNYRTNSGVAPFVASYADSLTDWPGYPGTAWAQPPTYKRAALTPAECTRLGIEWAYPLNDTRTGDQWLLGLYRRWEALEVWQEPNRTLDASPLAIAGSLGDDGWYAVENCTAEEIGGALRITASGGTGTARRTYDPAAPATYRFIEIRMRSVGAASVAVDVTVPTRGTRSIATGAAGAWVDRLIDLAYLPNGSFVGQTKEEADGRLSDVTYLEIGVPDGAVIEIERVRYVRRWASLLHPLTGTGTTDGALSLSFTGADTIRGIVRKLEGDTADGSAWVPGDTRRGWRANALIPARVGKPSAATISASATDVEVPEQDAIDEEAPDTLVYARRDNLAATGAMVVPLGGHPITGIDIDVTEPGSPAKLAAQLTGKDGVSHYPGFGDPWFGGGYGATTRYVYGKLIGSAVHGLLVPPGGAVSGDGPSGTVSLTKSGVDRGSGASDTSGYYATGADYGGSGTHRAQIPVGKAGPPHVTTVSGSRTDYADVSLSHASRLYASWLYSGVRRWVRSLASWFFHRVEAGAGIRYRRSDPGAPYPLVLDRSVTEEAGDAAPAIAVDPSVSDRILVLFGRGGDTYESYSDDDGDTWSEAEMAIPGGKYPAIATAPDGQILRAAVVGTGIQGQTRDPGSDWSDLFTFQQAGATALVVEDTGFGLAAAPENASRWILSVQVSGETEVSDWWSADDGRTWTRLT